MRIMKLATGLAVGYVLGARAGREKYEQIVAVAQKASGRPAPAPAPAESSITDLLAKDGGRSASEPAESPVAVVPDEADPETKPAVLPPVEPPAPATTGEQSRRPRNRRPKSATRPTTAGAGNETPNPADLDLDGPAMGAAEADIAEQKALVVDTRDEPAGSAQPLDSDTADVLEQRRSV